MDTATGLPSIREEKTTVNTNTYRDTAQDNANFIDNRIT